MNVLDYSYHCRNSRLRFLFDISLPRGCLSVMDCRAKTWQEGAMRADGKGRGHDDDDNLLT